jgi:hypothetical protein
MEGGRECVCVRAGGKEGGREGGREELKRRPLVRKLFVVFF